MDQDLEELKRKNDELEQEKKKFISGESLDKHARLEKELKEATLKLIVLSVKSLTLEDGSPKEKKTLKNS